jgi:SNF2 family DNA or RNA helicase
MRPFVLREYQKQAISFLLDTPRANLWAGMGTGKTSATLTMLSILKTAYGDATKTLVIAPKRVAQEVWPEQVAEWAHLKDLKLRAIQGNAKERLEVIKKPADAYTCTYEVLPWLVHEMGARWPFSRVVADESTRLKNFRLSQGGKRAKALGEVAHTQVTEWINLTGTPAPNGYTDVWGQQWFIDKGARLGRSYSAFERRWFARSGGAMGSRFGPLRPLPGAEQQIGNAIADCTFVIRPEDWFDLETPLVSQIWVELPTSAMKAYRDLQQDMAGEFSGVQVNAVNGLAKSRKCLQVATGAVYDDNRIARWSHDAKIEALQSLVAESGGEPLIVVYQHRHELERLRKAFPQGRTLVDAKNITELWNEGRVPLLFLHPRSAGHGLNLQHGGRTVVFFAIDWDKELHDQVIERIGPVRQAQSGYRRTVKIYYILAHKTLDAVVYDRLLGKGTAQDLLQAYVRSLQV